MKKINPSLLSAYWCHYVSTETEHNDRFFWAWEEIDDQAHQPSESTRLMLKALAASAPDKQAAAYLAAGPMEDFINLVVKAKLAAEAAFIVKDRDLSPLLPFVWGRADGIRSLAREYPDTVMLKNGYSPADLTGIQTLGLRELMSYWCSICTDSSSRYAASSSSILSKLKDESLHESVKKDLIASAPDELARKYLYAHVLSIR